MTIPPDRTIRGTEVVMAQLVRDIVPEGPLVLCDLYFVGCLILGPAVLALLGTKQFYDCIFNIAESDIQSIRWPWDDDGIRLGAIGVRNCLFENCRFESIGFTGPSEMLDDLSGALSSAPEI